MFAIAQDNCNITLQGQVLDESTGNALANAHLLIQEVNRGTASDAGGWFMIDQLCKGAYHIKVSHIGCETNTLYINLMKDTMLVFIMDHHNHHLEAVTISNQSLQQAVKIHSIQSSKIEENAHKDLGNQLEQISGVNVLRTGYNISKPIVHGLYGSRLLILNNGISQAGQQWGNDHSPEIDPLSANALSVIKGTSVIQYQGSSLGSIILVEPGKILSDPHLHGKTAYYFESNGRSHGIHTQFQKATDHGVSWKMTATLRKSGDRGTPEYYLRNTGRNEANASLMLEKPHNSQWKSNLYLSTFNTRIGILRGSHIGNLTDFTEAMTRETPFFTEPSFSYTLSLPYQSVSHHLAKLHSKYFIDDNRWIEFTSGTQFNKRNEYDLRRGNSSERPSLSLSQFSQFTEVKYSKEYSANTSISSGIQSTFINNTNNPGTGVLPLIPDYLSMENGLFSMLVSKNGIVQMDLGARYDLVWQNVYALSTTLPRTTLNFRNYFHNLNAGAGLSIKPRKNQKISVNLGYNTRNPAVNERFSGGLHQGVSGIEEGEPDLISEKAWKSTLSWEGNLRNWLFFDVTSYYQYVQNYIFLNPENEFRLTIRGAFPVFRYKQTNATLYGIDAGINLEVNDHIHISSKYSYIRGEDVSNNLPLIFIPPQQLQSAIKLHLNNFKGWLNPQIELNMRWVGEQKNYEESQDFLPPPPSYFLTGLKCSISRAAGNSKVNIYLAAENLLDVRYRDFLNRQRYFADELGRNIIAGIQVNF